MEHGRWHAFVYREIVGFLFVAVTRFIAVFTARYAAPTSVNIVDKRECC